MALQKTSERVPWWIQLIVIVGALLSAAGAIIALVNPAMLVGSQAEINSAAHVFASYFAARNLALACILLALFGLGARRALGQILALVGVIQLIDTVMDCLEGRWAVAPGVLILGLLFLLAATKLCRRSLWNRQAWLD
ncbi:MAG: hypothetical protein WCC26_13945 [Terracidiphilus sp.]